MYAKLSSLFATTMLAASVAHAGAYTDERIAPALPDSVHQSNSDTSEMLAYVCFQSFQNGANYRAHVQTAPENPSDRNTRFNIEFEINGQGEKITLGRYRLPVAKKIAHYFCQTGEIPGKTTTTHRGDRTVAGIVEHDLWIYNHTYSCDSKFKTANGDVEYRDARVDIITRDLDRDGMSAFIETHITGLNGSLIKWSLPPNTGVKEAKTAAKKFCQTGEFPRF